MTKNERLIWAINYLEKSLLSIPEDMTTAEIIEWADRAEINDAMAREQGYDDIENWAQETGHACFNSDYMEDVNPHMANRQEENTMTASQQQTLDLIKAEQTVIATDIMMDNGDLIIDTPTTYYIVDRSGYIAPNPTR
jgi:hypothetical protein